MDRVSAPRLAPRAPSPQPSWGPGQVDRRNTCVSCARRVQRPRPTRLLHLPLPPRHLSSQGTAMAKPTQHTAHSIHHIAQITQHTAHPHPRPDANPQQAAVRRTGGGVIKCTSYLRGGGGPVSGISKRVPDSPSRGAQHCGRCVPKHGAAGGRADSGLRQRRARTASSAMGTAPQHCGKRRAAPELVLGVSDAMARVVSGVRLWWGARRPYGGCVASCDVRPEAHRPPPPPVAQQGGVQLYIVCMQAGRPEGMAHGKQARGAAWGGAQ